MSVDAAVLTHNRLLATLPPSSRERLAPVIDEVELRAKQTLYAPEEPIEAVYFPLTAAISRLTLLAEGAAVEATLVGSEGMVGLSLFLGVGYATALGDVQAPGSALRLPAASFRDAVHSEPALRAAMGRYTLLRLTHLGQIAACNALHTVEPRCARWLLQMQDRVGVAEFALTHELLAEMLGVRRASVTLAAAGLQQSGLIRYARGHVTILDRERLEAAVCECYHLMAASTDQLLLRPGDTTP